MVGSVGTVLLKRGAWTEEDKLLRKCIEIYEGKWHKVLLRAGLNKCRKSCRLRWLNYLKPNINRGEFQLDEVDLIVRLHKLLGNSIVLVITYSSDFYLRQTTYLSLEQIEKVSRSREPPPNRTWDEFLPHTAPAEDQGKFRKDGEVFHRGGGSKRLQRRIDP
ncbi:hypothetical protein LWI28_007891 [Acer negundo]|uniref:Uncharacterized protein n=1 Tax=Acer negundo TaxID=4023 RepID=A0AAD5IDL4_ACENE|nr:hypothetical protein LWI28_007891 [Acer negundo]